MGGSRGPFQPIVPVCPVREDVRSAACGPQAEADAPLRGARAVDCEGAAGQNSDEDAAGGDWQLLAVQRYNQHPARHNRSCFYEVARDGGFVEWVKRLEDRNDVFRDFLQYLEACADAGVRPGTTPDAGAGADASD